MQDNTTKNKRKTLKRKYRTANIVRFIFEVVFIISLALTYLSMLAVIPYNAGPVSMFVAIVSFMMTAIFECRRLVLFLKIKKKEKEKMQKELVA